MARISEKSLTAILDRNNPAGVKVQAKVVGECFCLTLHGEHGHAVGAGLLCHVILFEGQRCNVEFPSALLTNS